VSLYKFNVNDAVTIQVARYNTAGPQDLDLVVADRSQSRQVGQGVY
jgi:hypothetical protein